MKRYITVTLILTLLLSLTAAVFAVTPTFSDINDPQTAQDAAVLQMLGVLEGDGTGRFLPDGTLTRAAFCKMAVVIMGRGDREAQNRSRTIFPDVRSDHWARGYINLAASGDGRIIAGNSDGTFAPDDNITYAQAITILLRVLGYTDSDTGLLWPSDHIRFAQSIKLTDGLSVESSSPIPRRGAARLFKNMLETKTKDGALFYTTLGSAVEDIVILDLNAEAADGEPGAIGTTGGVYKSKNGIVPEVFLGERGTLIVADGQAVTFLPSSGNSVTFIAASANAAWISDSAGKRYDIPEETTVYTPDGTRSFSEIFIDIKAGTQVTIYYKHDTIDAVHLELTGAQSAFVVTSDSVSPSAFSVLTGGASNYKIFRNGFEASFGDIKKYDVATYNSASKILTVSDFRVTAYYENVWPNTDYPSRVRFLGEEFPVLPSAHESLSSFRPGEMVTFLLTSDNQVAGVFGAKEVYAAPVGIASAVSTSSATVELLNGMVFTGNPQLSAEQAERLSGELVYLTSPGAGIISISRVSGTGGYAFGVNLNAMTFGTTKLSPGVRIFDKVGNSGVIPVNKSDILQGTVPANKILFLGKDSGGQIDIIILNNATGDIYEYGFLKRGYDASAGEEVDSYTRRTASIENSNGKTPAIVTGIEFKDGAVGGIALSAGKNAISSIVMLTGRDNIRRSAFKTIGERTYISISGEDIPVADNVQCYNKTTGGWFASLDEARAYSDNLTVYYDRPALENGKIRVVAAG